MCFIIWCQRIYYKLFPSSYGLSPESTSNITDPLAPYDKTHVLIKSLSLPLFVESPLFDLHDSPIPLLPAFVLDIVTNPNVTELLVSNVILASPPMSDLP